MIPDFHSTINAMIDDLKADLGSKNNEIQLIEDKISREYLSSTIDSVEIENSNQLERMSDYRFNQLKYSLNCARENLNVIENQLLNYQRLLKNLEDEEFRQNLLDGFKSMMSIPIDIKKLF
jgi:hypothetical protein